MTVSMTSLRLREGNNIFLSQFRFWCIDTLYLTLYIFVYFSLFYMICVMSGLLDDLFELSALSLAL